jgi:hypothetical protein
VKTEANSVTIRWLIGSQARIPGHSRDAGLEKLDLVNCLGSRAAELSRTNRTSGTGWTWGSLVSASVRFGGSYSLI